MEEKSYLRCLSVVVLISLGLAFAQARLPRAASRPMMGHGLETMPHRGQAASPSKLKSSLARIPLHFEVNAGQTDEQVRFLARGSGYSLFLTPNETVLSLKCGVRNAEFGVKKRHSALRTPHSALLRMRLVGANPQPKVTGRDKLPGVVNYFIGNDPRKWRTKVPTYAQVKYEDVYPGVDVVYYGNPQQLEYDFIVSPGVDPKTIALELEGADQVEVDAHGDLVLRTAAGEVRQRKPRIYQDINGKRKEIAGGYVLKSQIPNPKSQIDNSQSVTFAVGDYDKTAPLIIDPVLILTYSTLLGGDTPMGGAFSSGTGIAVDRSGNAYVVGHTNTTDFPTQNPLQPMLRGATDAFVAKFNASGSALIYATYLGGSMGSGGNIEQPDIAITIGAGIALDTENNAYVTGYTSTLDFPTMNAFQPASGGSFDGFMAKLDSTGSMLLYSTYLGGDGDDRGAGIAVGENGNAYITGGTSSTNFPTQNPLQSALDGPGDAFVTKINTLTSGANSLVYSTYLGGPGGDGGQAIAVDGQGNACVTGVGDSGFPNVNGLASPSGVNVDAFVAKLNPDGSGLLYSTLLGGEGVDAGNGIGTDSFGNVYVTGFTGSPFLFPIKNAFQPRLFGSSDAFVAKINPSAAGDSSLLFSTFLGGGGGEQGNAIAVTPAGDASVVGFTDSSDFPTLDPLPFAGNVFVTQFSPTGLLIFSTRFGGSDMATGRGIAVDLIGSVYITGEVFISASPPTPFPVTPGAFQTQVAQDTTVAFVAKISVQEQFLLSALTPNRGGNTGDVTVTIQGDGFALGATVRLVGAGGGEIVGDVRRVSDDRRALTVTFNLRGATPGVYDVTVMNPDGDLQTLPGGFTVEEGGAAEVWVEISGRTFIRTGRETPFIVLCGNSGNINAKGVLLIISGIPKDVQMRLAFELKPAPLSPALEPFRADNEISPIIETDTGKSVMLFIGLIPPGATRAFLFYLNPPLGTPPFQLKAAAIGPFFGSPLQPSVADCIIAAFDFLLTEISRVLGQFIPVPCVSLSFEELIKSLEESVEEDAGGTTPANSFGSQLAADLKALFECVKEVVGDFVGGDPAAILEIIKEALAAFSDFAQLQAQCIAPPPPPPPPSPPPSSLPPRNPPPKDVVPGGSFDPNDKVGAGGAGAQRFISGEEPLRYAVFFENLETATAPAQEVVITDQLDPTTMDLSTFNLGPIAFGNTEVVPPTGSKNFMTDVDLRPAQNLIVRIVVQLDLNTGLLTYRFTSLDPATGQPPDDPLAGFLPPNINPPEGDGSVVFTVMPHRGLPTGTVIRNKARIIFDQNPPIDTPEWFNTIDNEKPTSQIAALPAMSPTNFTVQWSGNDPGSGIRDFTVFVSDDGGPFVPLLINTTQTSTTFQGQLGHTYGFIVVARDNTFNIEDAPNLPDAVTSAVNAVDVTAQLRISRGKINQPTTGRGYVRRTFRRRGGGTGPATQIVTIKNKGNSSIAGPLSLVLDQLSPNATLSNATGRTMNVAPLGSPFISVNVGNDNVLSPNEAVKVLLEFTNPSGNRITYRARALAGEGAR